MEAFMRLNGVVNGIVWGPPMLALLVGTGIYLSVILGFPQVRYFGFMFKEVLGKIG
ncbi:MAG TPA: sodium:alanine symporter family protein, partial [Synergistales bacterium]|nr:sodium:alanine symporter family protein [Synergistales bacterium]